MYESLENFPLRKINFVKTRTTILKAVSHLLKEKDFSSITVDEICSRAQISRGTFFNYFSTKDHVFHYFLRIFTIRIALRIKQWPDDLSFEEKIREIYKWFNEETQYSRFVDSYINFLLTVGEENNEMKLIDAEFVYFFNGIEEEEYAYYNNLTLNTLFQDICKKAQEAKEISLSDQPKELANLFAGVLVSSYITDQMNGDVDHLAVFSKIWK
ncbi:TetR/AcrR family transcriptional regulator [Niameybacter massiliensis]|uniref:TetR/AcrR family transcriptional regulator n=1 Tax=Holtiella tumoricola TaxID=3018743 RepID=A0AA42IZW5_9FIRM|nr:MULTISPECIES: TetR/AcrR family transcriptional regulator [Lachnospirales]MDA3730561.1 TetR/AcrR family transcriptional regulator [Holtiella tumoricola]